MAVERYRYDPHTGSVFQLGEGGESPYDGNVAYLLNGRYTLSGTRLIEVSTGRIAENLGAGDVFITRTGYASGATMVNVASEIAEGSLNGPSRRLATYSITGGIRVQSESGNEHSIDIEAASITGLGERLLTYFGENNKQYYRTVKQGDAEEAAIREMFGPTTRWANSREYVQSSIAGYIRAHGDRLLTELRAGGGLRDASGVLQTSNSGLIQALAQVARDGLSYRKNVFINTMGNIRGMYD